MIFTDKITVYNHYTEGEYDKWKKTVLDGQWSPDRKMDIGTDNTLHVVNYATVSIPWVPGYVKTEEFKGDGFTFTPANLDVVARGEQDIEITEDNLSEVLKKEDFLTIISVNDNTHRDNLKYWRLTAG